MYGAPYIFHFVHPLVKTAEMMVQRVNFEQNLKNIRPATVRILPTPIPLYASVCISMTPHPPTVYIIKRTPP